LQFDAVLDRIAELFPEGLSESYFNRINIFYSLFLAVYHSLYGLPGCNKARPPLNSIALIEQARAGLDRVSEILDDEEFVATEEDKQFKKDIRLATTDIVVRQRRTAYLLSLMS
jgi:hypothetical protein